MLFDGQNISTLISFLKEEFTQTWRFSQYLLTQMLMGSFVVHKNGGESIKGK